MSNTFLPLFFAFGGDRFRAYAADASVMAMRRSSNRHTVVYRSWSASQERAVLRHPKLLHAAPSIVPTSFGMLLMRLDVAKTRRESGVARTDVLKAPWPAQGSVATTCAIG